MASTGLSLDDLEWIRVNAGATLGGGAVIKAAETVIDPETGYSCDELRRVTISENVLVSQKAVIEPGSCVGAHSIISAYAHVTEDKQVGFCEMATGSHEDSNNAPMAFRECKYWHEGMRTHIETAFVVVIMLLGTFWVTMFAMVNTFFAINPRGGTGDIMLAVAVCGVIYTAMDLLYSIIFKYIYTDWRTDASMDTTYKSRYQYLRTIQMHAIFAGFQILLGGPLYNVFLNLQGAKVALSAVIATPWVYDPESVTIGSNVCIDAEATVSPHILNGACDIRKEPIIIGKDTYVGVNALILGRSNVPAGTIIGPNEKFVANSPSGEAYLTHLQAMGMKWYADELEAAFPGMHAGSETSQRFAGKRTASGYEQL